ncbi:MAG: hypothetical protein MJH11_11260 [Lentisphaeria bacterium]|nr:hypothetical protein [Lentisphaeria bacterium]
MTPDIQSHYDLQFTAPVSAWFLVLLIPLAVAGVIWLYKNQYKGQSRPVIIGLTALRLLLVLSIVIILFRPNLIYRQTLSYKGRVIFLFDNSESMSTSDSRMSPDLALRLARNLDPSKLNEKSPFAKIAQSLGSLEIDVLHFANETEDLSRESDKFWNSADGFNAAVKTSIDDIKSEYKTLPEFWKEHLKATVKFVDTAKAARSKVTRAEINIEKMKKEGEDVSEMRLKLDKLRLDAFEAGQIAREHESTFKSLGAIHAQFPEHLAALENELQSFTQGNKATGKVAYDNTVKTLFGHVQNFEKLQGFYDQDSIDAGDKEIIKALENSRATSRLDLIRAKLKISDPVKTDLSEKQNIIFRNLSTEIEPSAYAIDKAQRSNISDVLNQIALDESPFPVSGVVLISDGRNDSVIAHDELIQSLSRKQIPVYTVAAAAEKETRDIALISTVAPPFAVQGKSVGMSLKMKASIDAAESVTLSIHEGKTRILEKTIDLKESGIKTIELPFTPEQLGLQQYTITVSSLKGEAFPKRNNKMTLAMDIRKEKINVLFLDWKPRWESRFILNIFQRLSYVDLNSIIVISNKGAELTRGVSRGQWPKDESALKRYDVIILGETPADLLKETEWNAISNWVTDGGTLWLMGNNKVHALPESMSSWIKDDKLIEKNAEHLDEFHLTETGQLFPPTRAFSMGMQKGDIKSPHLIERNGVGIMQTQLLGKGKLFYSKADLLWKLLNPRSLKSHTDLYVELLTWSLQGGYQGGMDKGINLDRLSYGSRDMFQVYLPTLDGTLQLQQGDTNTELKATSGRVVVDALTSGSWTLTAGDDKRDLVIIDDNPELHFLSLDKTYMKQVARSTGGQFYTLDKMERIYSQLKPRVRVENKEKIYRLWDMKIVFLLLIVVLSFEWIWRKWTGLV